jgi:hypothetical protein
MIYDSLGSILQENIQHMLNSAPDFRQSAREALNRAKTELAAMEP